MYIGRERERGIFVEREEVCIFLKIEEVGRYIGRDRESDK